MGKNKALIEIEGIPIIERIHTLFKKLFQEILIITDQEELFTGLGAKIHNDLVPNLGALGGLYTGVSLGSFPHSFCVGCDMPFLREPLIDFLLSRINKYETVVPKTKDGLQPLHTIYSKTYIKPIRKIITKKMTKIIDFYPLVNLRIVEEDEFRILDPGNESFFNVNTPEDLAFIQARKYF